jgi:Flp pilus assembly protein TadD
MTVKQRLVLGLVVFTGLGTALYFLPRSVVSPGKKLETARPASDSSAAVVQADVHATPPGVREEIESLRKQAGVPAEKSSQAGTFEKLARAYARGNRFDSAGYFYEKAQSLSGKDLSYESGSAYYEALAFTRQPSQAEVLAGKARTLLEKVPASDPRHTESQARAALTWVNSPTPMKGILRLRELAEKNPDNEFVAFQLGMLSFQSGQYDKAVARFEKVTRLNPENVNAWFYLAQSHQQTGNLPEARKAIDKGLPLAKEEDTKASFAELRKLTEEK